MVKIIIFLIFTYIFQIQASVQWLMFPGDSAEEVSAIEPIYSENVPLPEKSWNDDQRELNIYIIYHALKADSLEKAIEIMQNLFVVSEAFKHNLNNRRALRKIARAYVNHDYEKAYNDFKNISFSNKKYPSDHARLKRLKLIKLYIEVGIELEPAYLIEAVKILDVDLIELLLSDGRVLNFISADLSSALVKLMWLARFQDNKERRRKVIDITQLLLNAGANAKQSKVKLPNALEELECSMNYIKTLKLMRPEDNLDSIMEFLKHLKRKIEST